MPFARQMSSNFDYRIKGSAGSSPNRCDREKRPAPPRDVIADRLRKALRVHSEAVVHANPMHVRLPDSSGNCGLFRRQMRMFRNVDSQFAGRADCATLWFDPLPGRHHRVQHRGRGRVENHAEPTAWQTEPVEHPGRHDLFQFRRRRAAFPEHRVDVQCRREQLSSGFRGPRTRLRSRRENADGSSG